MRRKQLAEFTAWLLDNDAEILPPTNPYELLRYKHPDCGTAVVYTNKHGSMNISEVTLSHFKSFQKGQAIKINNRPAGHRRLKTIDTLMKRDGHDCCICGLIITDEDVSIEHWLAISAGGTNHPSNLALAHKDCNNAVSSMPVIEKIKVRDLVRQVIAKMQPHEKFDIKNFLKPVDVAG